MISTKSLDSDHAVSSENSALNASAEPSDRSFARVFHTDAIIVFGEDATKSTVITQLVDRLAKTARLCSEHTAEIIDRISSRERMASTAFGRGFAFPHLRTLHVQEFIGAIGIFPSGVAFDSNDGDQTKVVFLTLSPHADRGQHIELLSRLVSLLSNKAAIIQLTTSNNALSLYQSLCRLDSR